MQIHDISLTIDPARLPVWPGDPRLELSRFLSVDQGDPVNASRLACSVHVGTHVDAAIHHVRNGAGTDTLSLETLIGTAWVLDCGPAAIIDAEILRSAYLPVGVTRLLLRTSNSAVWDRPDPSRFFEDFVALSKDAAEWIVANGVTLVGIDYMSIERYDADVPVVHQTLLNAGVVIVEGLDLRNIHPGEYKLICLPLKLADCDGAPARAVLIEESPISA